MDKQLLPDRLPRRAAQRVRREEPLPDVGGEYPAHVSDLVHDVHTSVHTHMRTLLDPIFTAHAPVIEVAVVPRAVARQVAEARVPEAALRVRQARHLPLHRAQEVGGQGVVAPREGLRAEEFLVHEGVEHLDLRVDPRKRGLRGAEGAVCVIVGWG